MAILFRGADGSFTTNGGPLGMFGGGGGPTSFYAESILCNRLYHTSGISELYKTTALTLLDEVWNEGDVLEEIDRAERLITPHLHHRQQSTPEAIRSLREFIRGRRKVVMKELEDSPFPISPEPRKPTYQVTVGEVVGTFEAYWQDRPEIGQRGEGQADIKLKLESDDVVLVDQTATVTEFRLPQFGPPGGGPGFGGPEFGGPGFGGPGLGGQPRNGSTPQPPPVIITITGNKAGGGQPISMSFFIDRATYRKAANQKVSINGMLTEGRQFGFGFGGPQGKSVHGELWLTKAGSSSGAEVAGRLDLKVVEVHGGFFNQPPIGVGGPRPVTDREQPVIPAAQNDDTGSDTQVPSTHLLRIEVPTVGLVVEREMARDFSHPISIHIANRWRIASD